MRTRSPHYAAANALATRASGHEALPGAFGATGLQPLVDDRRPAHAMPRRVRPVPSRGWLGRREALVLLAIAVACVAGAFLGTWLAMRSA